MKKRSLAIIALAAMGLSLTACGNSGSAKTETKAETTAAAAEGSEKAEETKAAEAKAEETKAAAEAKAEIKEMKGDAIKKIVEDKKEKENYMIVDVRSPEEYAAGHINFAINMPIDTFKDNLSRIEDWKDKNVIVYCNSGKKSGEAADILVSNGFTKVFNGEGVKKFSYDLKTFGNIRGSELMEKAKDALVVDAREAKDYEAGHFATAVNVNPEDTATIDAILPDDKNALILTHCYSGNRSAVVAEYIASKGYTNVWNSLDGTKEIEYDFSKGDK